MDTAWAHASEIAAAVADGRTSAAAVVDAAAHALDLKLEPTWKSAVKTNLEVTLAFAALFADFPLPDDAELAPVFSA